MITEITKVGSNGMKGKFIKTPIKEGLSEVCDKLGVDYLGN